MIHKKLFELEEPCFFIMETDDGAFQDLSFQLADEDARRRVRRVRGGKSRTVPAFFNEIAAALQFPYYFGENWAAFEECITDLDWIEGTAYLLMINNANLLFSKADDEDFRILLRLLGKANEEWREPNTFIPRSRPPTPFHVLFHCTTGETAAFSERLAKAQILPTRLEESA